MKKKEAKKTSLALARAGEPSHNPNDQKFFASFFQKRSAVFFLAFTFLASAQAGQLNQAEKKLDAAKQSARRHQAAAAAAQNAATAAQVRQADLVTQEIAAAAALRASEDQTAAIAATLTDLTSRTKAAGTELEADAASIAPLLPLITRLALHPAATLLAADGAPGRAAEGALVMQGLTRQIAARATALRQARTRYAKLTTDLTTEQSAMTASVTAQQTSETTLQADIAAVRRQAQAAATRHATERAAAARAAATAHDLIGVIAQLRSAQLRSAQLRSAQIRSERRAAAHQAAARVPAPALPQPLRGAPVAGKLVRRFGAETAGGPATGDTFAAAPGAVVGAACTGRVVFAKPFESYGKLLILDCGGGYDFVMAGLDRLDATTGQPVRAGQPVGAMAHYEANDPGNQPRLYVELRDNGTAIDPAGHFSGNTPLK